MPRVGLAPKEGSAEVCRTSSVCLYASVRQSRSSPIARLFAPHGRKILSDDIGMARNNEIPGCARKISQKKDGADRDQFLNFTR
jgi:hypothetical protein